MISVFIMDTRTFVQLTALAINIAVAIFCGFGNADRATTASSGDHAIAVVEWKIYNASTNVSGSAKRNDYRIARVTGLAAGQEHRKPKSTQHHEGTATSSPGKRTPATGKPAGKKHKGQNKGKTTKKTPPAKRRSATEASQPASLPTPASTPQNAISSTTSSTITATTSRISSPVTADASTERGGRFLTCDEPCICKCEKELCHRSKCSSVEKGDQDQCSVKCWDKCLTECGKTHSEA